MHMPVSDERYKRLGKGNSGLDGWLVCKFWQ